MEDEHITIGIEGLVGAGKTSLCRELLNMVPDSILLHGGNLYRGIIFAVMNSKFDIEQAMRESIRNNTPIDIKKVMDMLKVNIKIENRESVVYVDGVEIDEDNLQSDETSMAVSKIAKDVDNSKLYSFAKKLIDVYKEKFNVIISGRDLMQIYPNLDYHFFITATLDSRTQRKAVQYKDSINKETFDINVLRKHIEERDELQEKSGFYKRYKNTVDIDVTDCKSAKESAEKVFNCIKGRRV